MNIRAFEAGDEPAIYVLFEEVFGKPVSEEYWNWRYLDNPVDTPRIMLAWEGTSLAAHYAVSPMRLSTPDGPALAALSMTTMTGPDYQGLGLFPKLAEALYAELATAGYVGVFGFPNARSHVPFVDKLGWSDIVPQHTLTLDLTARRVVRIPDNVDLTLSAGSPTPGDAALRARCLQGCVGVLWDEKMLAWRLDPRAGAEYCTHRAVRGDGEVVALLTWKRYSKSAVDLVDVVAMDTVSLAWLVTRFGEEIEATGITKVNLWIPLRDKAHRVFERYGALAGGPVTYFSGRTFAETPALLDGRAWQITMLTSDVY